MLLVVNRLLRGSVLGRGGVNRGSAMRAAGCLVGNLLSAFCAIDECHIDEFY